MKIGRVSITGGFALLWGFLIYIGAAGSEHSLLPLFFFAALLHEAGHVLAIAFCGCRIDSVEFNAGGAVMNISSESIMSYGREIFCTLAGSLFGLLCALIFCFIGDIIIDASTLSGLCLLQSVFNLLPANGLDGGKALELFLLSKNPENTVSIMRAVTLPIAWVMTAAGAVAFFLSGYNPTLLVTAVFAVWAALGGNNERYLQLPAKGSKTRALHRR